MKKIIVVLLLLSMALNYTYAQDTSPEIEKIVKVHLKDGSIISGALQSWTYEKEIVIVTEGVTLRFPDDKVKRVVEVEKHSKVKVPVEHRNNGLYYSAKAQILAGNEGNRAHHKVGYGITASVGYQWNQFLALGVGTGYRQIIWDSGEKMIPVFAEVRGYINNNAIRPFYNIDIGYSFGLTDDELGLIKSEGGLLVYPSFGISFGRQKLKYSFDLGYMFQDNKVTYGNDFDDRIRTEQDLKYQRLTLRFGVTF